LTHFIAYYRVSTERQGRSGLGLDAQREKVEAHIAREGGSLAGEFVEVESGRNDARPMLRKALAAAKAMNARLIVAKLDRLARSARFLLTVVEGAGEEGVAFCDLPTIPAGPVGRFMLTQLAAVAELEAGLISERTKSALAVAKARGVKLGNPRLQPGNAPLALKASQAASARAKARALDVLPYVQAAQSAGAVTLAQIAQALEARGVRTAQGKINWSAAQVSRILKAA
jgi:DNA invertase Pin-like site-specific DNA recombinase